MKNIVRIIGVSLASMAGILLVSGVAWAQAEEKAIAYLIGNCWILEEPEREWVDEDGIRHTRDVRYSCDRRRRIAGKEIGWWSEDIDSTGGHRFIRGYYSFTGTVLGESATGVGRVTEECDRIEGVWICTGHDVMHLQGGGLVKASAAWQGAENPLWSGTLLDPPGGGKRNGPRSK
jgi:hypothetical protein